MEESQNSRKRAGDLDTKRFSRYGEFLVSFELSKYGWNVYDPVYDEYVDFVIHKHRCAAPTCKKLWAMTPALICNECGKDFSKSEKKNIRPILCGDCGMTSSGTGVTCQHCGGGKVVKRPTCDVCKGEVEIKKHVCSCGSENFETLFRTIQVKSSRIEYDAKTGKSKNTYAVDMKPRDLIEGADHFYVWCLLDDDDHAHFLVMSVDEYVQTMGQAIHTVAFLKDQDRQHFSSKNFGKWAQFEDNFEILEN